MSRREEAKIYKIGQAAAMLEVKTSVLRFWEGEFEQLEPIRTPSGQRLYSEEHVVLLKRIRKLLYDEGLTLEGARKKLESGYESDFEEKALSAEASDSKSDFPLFSPDLDQNSPKKNGRELLFHICEELRSIKNLLE